jgi:hypothetical protein
MIDRAMQAGHLLALNPVAEPLVTIESPTSHLFSAFQFFDHR